MSLTPTRRSFSSLTEDRHADEGKGWEGKGKGKGLDSGFCSIFFAVLAVCASIFLCDSSDGEGEGEDKGDDEGRGKGKEDERKEKEKGFNEVREESRGSAR